MNVLCLGATYGRVLFIQKRCPIIEEGIPLYHKLWYSKSHIVSKTARENRAYKSDSDEHEYEYKNIA